MKFEPPVRYAVVAAILLLASASHGWTFRNVSPGMEAPDFTLRTLDGDELNLKRTLQTGPVLVVFWATWSDRSLQQMQESESLVHSLGYSAIQLVGVNVEGQNLPTEKRQQVIDWVQAHGLNAILLWDHGLSVYNEYGVISVPSSLLINQEGTVLTTINGYSSASREHLRSVIDSLLGLTKGDGECMQTVVLDGPDRNSSLHRNLGHSLLRKGFTERAIEEFKKSIEFDTTFVQAYLDLAHAFLLEGDQKEALAALNSAEAIAPDHPMILLRLGQYYEKSGDLDQAIKYLTKALVIDEELVEARLRRIKVYAHMGEISAAQADLKAVAGIAADDPRLMDAEAAVCEANGDMARATELLRKAVAATMTWE